MTDVDTLQPKRQRHRVFWIFFLVVQAVFLVWIIAGAHSGAHTSCSGLSSSDCTNAHEVGNTIAVGVIIFLWAAVDLILGVTYGLYRLVKRGSQ